MITIINIISTKGCCIFVIIFNIVLVFV